MARCRAFYHTKSMYLQVVEVLLAVPARGADLHGATGSKSGIPLSEAKLRSARVVVHLETLNALRYTSQC